MPAQGVYWSATTNTLLARWQFYFGSDSRSNFFESGSRNFLDSDYAEKIGLGSHWSHENVQVAVNSVMSPVNDITASRIYPASPGSAYLESRSLFALPAGDYIYRVWLWQDTPSTAPTTLQLTHQLTDYNRDTGLQTVTLRTDNITLSSAPKEYIFPVSTIGPGYIQSRFGVPTSFAIWGAVLTPATHSQSYQREPHVVHLTFPPTSNSPANITRQYSTALLAFHSLLLCFAGAYLLISAWRRKSPAHVFLFTLLMLVLLEALLVIPEQRFMQLILACNILLAVLACGSWSRNPKRFWMN